MRSSTGTELECSEPPSRLLRGTIRALRAAGWIALLPLVAGGQEPSGDGPGLASGARLFLGHEATCAVDGDAVTCTGAAELQLPRPVDVLGGAPSVVFGLHHGCLLDSAGEAACWGDGSSGQLGVDPTAIDTTAQRRPGRRTPAAVPGLPRMRSLAAGWVHTCGLALSGSVLCWGDNYLQQLGKSGAGPAPTAVEGLQGAVLALSAGGQHTCALLADGGVRCWGNGSVGQLGNGKAEEVSAPIAVAGLEHKVVGIAAGAYHSCARLDSGAVACWGDNRFGQLGDGTRTRRLQATLVKGLPAPALAVSLGSSFSCALLGDDTVHCWGSNELGELGNGTDPSAPLAKGVPAQSDLPTPVRGPATVTALYTAADHACTSHRDGSLFCWGGNYSGQLGDGTAANRATPVRWSGLEAPPPPPIASPSKGELIGLDVSYHSGHVDWQAAADQGHRFGLTLATAGDDFRDPLLSAHWHGMRRAGLVAGAYHYFIAADDPVQQAHHFLANLLFETGDLAPVVDIESAGGNPPPDLEQRLRTFLDEVEASVGVKPIIYTGPNFWNAHIKESFGEHPLWIAEYGVDTPKIPNGWSRWHLWQWRGNANVPEIAEIVDLNRAHPEVDLSSLLVPALHRRTR